MTGKHQDVHFKNLVSMVSSMFYSANEYYKSIGLQYVEVPAIVGITGACENVDTLFKVKSRTDVPLFFTQTGQLTLEQALQHVPGVYTIIHSGRDEVDEDERHLRQFRLTEEEFDCSLAGMTRENYDENKMFIALLEHIESATKAMIRGVLKNHKKELKSHYLRDINILGEILDKPYLKIEYEDAVKLLNKNGFEELRFGDDLGAIQEVKVVEIVNKMSKGYGKKLEEFSPVFIMKYPKEIKFFNMKVPKADDRVVLSADCVFPYSGEGVGSAVREHDGVKLLVRLLTSNMYKIYEANGGKYDDFKWYTEDMILSGKTNPHAGYGIGNERVMQFILGMSDIRDASLFSLMNRQTNDWNPRNLKKGGNGNAFKRITIPGSFQFS